MKAFIVVSLACFLGAASAGLTTPAVQLKKTPDECRQQAYLETLNCTKFGFHNGTTELQCLSSTVLEFIKCIEESAPIVLGEEVHLLGASLTGIGKQTIIDKFICVFNNILDTIKCIVEGHIKAGIPRLNWGVIIKCILTNLPGLLVCFPQNA